MARALQDILRELDTVYNPQKDVINKSITSLDPAQEAEQKGLEAAKTDAFAQITDQANRRGLFYSGIPIAEEQRYTGGSYLPAVANLRSRYAQQRFNLQDALAKITENQYMKAYGVRQNELDTEAAERAAAAARAAAAGGGFSPSLGGLGGMVMGARATKSLPQQSNVPPELQDLYNKMFLKSDGGRWSDQNLVNDYNATLRSARNGNVRDKQKLELYHSARPDLFGSTIPSLAGRASTSPATGAASGGTTGRGTFLPGLVSGPNTALSAARGLRL